MQTITDNMSNTLAGQTMGLRSSFTSKSPHFRASNFHNFVMTQI